MVPFNAPREVARPIVPDELPDDGLERIAGLSQGMKDWQRDCHMS